MGEKLKHWRPPVWDVVLSTYRAVLSRRHRARLFLMAHGCCGCLSSVCEEPLCPKILQQQQNHHTSIPRGAPQCQQQCAWHKVRCGHHQQQNSLFGVSTIILL